MQTFVNPTDEASFTSLISNINNGIEETRVSINDCIDDYNARKDDIDLWQKFLDWFSNAMSEVRENLVKASEKFAEFLAAVADYLSPGNPFVMQRMSDDWVLVKTKITGSKTTITGEYLRADSTWKGATGDRYGDLAGRQRLAIDTLAGYTDSMINFLSDYSKKILEAWIDFGSRLLVYMIDQVDAAAAFITADPLEWLDVVPKIVTLCTNIASLGVDLAALLAKNFTASKDMADQLKQDMANMSGFPTGAWPSATIV